MDFFKSLTLNDSPLPLFRVIVYSRSWVRKLVTCLDHIIIISKNKNNVFFSAHYMKQNKFIIFFLK